MQRRACAATVEVAARPAAGGPGRSTGSNRDDSDVKFNLKYLIVRQFTLLRQWHGHTRAAPFAAAGEGRLGGGGHPHSSKGGVLAYGLRWILDLKSF